MTLAVVILRPRAFRRRAGDAADRASKSVVLALSAFSWAYAVFEILPMARRSDWPRRVITRIVLWCHFSTAAPLA